MPHLTRSVNKGEEVNPEAIALYLQLLAQRLHCFEMPHSAKWLQSNNPDGERETYENNHDQNQPVYRSGIKFNFSRLFGLGQ